MSSTFLRIVRAAALACAIAAPLACQEDLAFPPRCKDIPAGGCPKRSIDVCADATCEAVYACNADGTWTKASDCAPRAPVPAVDGGADATAVDGAPDAPIDASMDAPAGAWGGPGCADLQAPECSLGLALSCATDCCGCEDLFVCEAGGWTSWGTCVAGVPTHR